MKLYIYSDIHLEFEDNFTLPDHESYDMMILAGDIAPFVSVDLLSALFSKWKGIILYVAGNHEYYNCHSIEKAHNDFRFLERKYPHVKLLRDQEISISGINFFGGTMWTDFKNSDPISMLYAQKHMSDFKFIMSDIDCILTPQDTINFHNVFVKKLIKWFEKNLIGPRIVITHHAPVKNKNTKYLNSNFDGAFCSLDMISIIEKYQPEVWIYGHTHECDYQTIGKTVIVSNQRGYPITTLPWYKNIEFECKDFCQQGTVLPERMLV